MRSLTIVTAALLALPVIGVSAVSAAPDRVCLDVRKIENAESKDGKIMIFHMRDGTVLKNHLKTQCDDLMFGGFTWGVDGSDNRVCEDAETLRTFQTHQVCALGKFERPIPTPKR